MTWQPGERPAVRCAVSIARDYGFGNVIQRIQAAWALHLYEEHGRDPAVNMPTGLARQIFGRGWAAGYDKARGLKALREFVGGA